MSQDVGRMMAEALKSQMPSLKTQAQFTAFMVTFDAFRGLMDATFSLDPARVVECRDVFEKALKASKDVTELGLKFEEVPPENRGVASDAFTQPPKEYQEYDIQKQLILELEKIETLAELSKWYLATTTLRSRVVSQVLRNVLIDMIRDKRLLFEAAEKGDS